MTDFALPPSPGQLSFTGVTYSPLNQASNVAVASNIVFTFSDAIQRGSGSIVLKTSAGAIIASYDAATSSNLTFLGNTLTINPTNDLGIFTGYKLEIGAGSIRDLVGNSYTSLSDYNFTTQTIDGLYHFFVVAFNAAPGAAYMGQLADAYNFPLGLKEIVNIFTTKSQFTDVYPTALSNQQFASTLVANIIKTSATDAAKTAAAADIVAAIEISHWSRGDVIFTVFGNLATKPLTDPTWGNTAKQFANETAVAKYFTETMHKTTTDLPTLRAVVGEVTQDTDVSSPTVIATLIGVELSHIGVNVNSLV